MHLVKYFIFIAIFISLQVCGVKFTFADCLLGNFGYTDNPINGKIDKINDDEAGDEDLGYKVIVNGEGVCKEIEAGDGTYSRGKYSGIKVNTACGARVVWVQDGAYSEYNGKATIKICSSQCIMGVLEQCYTLTSTSTKKTIKKAKYLGTELADLYAELLFLSKTEIGDLDVSSGDDRYGHRVGYIYNLYSGECPYSNDDTIKARECLAQQAEGKVIKDYYKNVPYSSRNNCYEAVRDEAESCQALGAISECPCIDKAAKGDCNKSSQYMPNKNSGYWKSLTSKLQSCHACYANVNKQLNMCLNASFDKGYGYGPEDNISEKFASLMKKMKIDTSDDNMDKYLKYRKIYGTGQYICGYHASHGYKYTRSGCLKLQSTSAPRPFPRIARSLDVNQYDKNIFFQYPSANLFTTAAIVKEFNDVAIGGCGGEKEVGETVRGDFYNPSLKIKYGLNEVAIWFNPPNSSKFMAKYRTTDSQYDNDIVMQSKISEWATVDPVAVEYGQRDDAGDPCSYVLAGKEIGTERICTRIEFDDDMDEAWFVAYRVQKQNAPSRSCNSHMKNDDLVKLGGVIRPPLKYKYNETGEFSYTPILLSNPIAGPSQLEAVVKLNPVVNEYFIQADGAKVLFTNTNTTPTAAAESVLTKTATLKMSNPTISKDKTTTTTTQMLDDKNLCTWILNHKICIGSFLGINCKLLDANNEYGIRSDILLGNILSSGDCPKDDATACMNELKAFSIYYPQCVRMKRCLSGSTRQACENSGSMHIKLASDDVSKTLYNYEWSDAVCITQGIVNPDFTPDTGTATTFAPFGNITEANDSVISFLIDENVETSSSDELNQTNTSSANINGQQIAARKGGSVVNTGAYDLIPVDAKYFSLSSVMDKVDTLIKILNSNGSLTEKYFGTGCVSAECVAKKITVRSKNIDELGLCKKFDRINSIEYGHGMEGSGYGAGSTYQLYIPHKCDFMEAQVLAPGGKSEQWNDDARMVWRTMTGGYAAAYCLLKPHFCGGAGGTMDSDDCDYVSEACHETDQDNNPLTSGAGGGGGYVHGIINLKALDMDVLEIKPAKDTSNNRQYCCPANTFEACNDQSNRKWIEVDSDLILSNTSFISYLQNTSTPLLFAKGGAQKQIDDQPAIGGGGNYSTDYITPTGYAKTCTEMKKMPDIPMKPMYSEESCDDSVSTPTFDSFKNKCDGIQNVCCNKTTQDYATNVCKELKTTKVNSACTVYSTKKDTSVYDKFVADCKNNPCCTSNKTACYLNTTQQAWRTDRFTRQDSILGGYSGREECEKEEKASNLNYFQCSSLNNGTDIKDSIAVYIAANDIYNKTSHYNEEMNHGTIFRCVYFDGSGAKFCSCDIAINCEYLKSESYEQCVAPTPKISGTQNEICEYQRLYAAETVTDYCCENQQCKSEYTLRDTDRDKAKIKSYDNNEAKDYGDALLDWEDDWDDYKNTKADNAKIVEEKFTTIIKDMCPLVVYGENGEHDEISGGDGQTMTGGGNVMIKMLNAISNNCTGTKDSDDNLVYDEKCTRYRMTEEYCNRSCAGDNCTALKWLDNNTDIITSHQFKGSGGCMRDHYDHGSLMTGAKNKYTDDNDEGDDKEAFGGDGWIKLTVPYVQYDVSGTIPTIKDGVKVLDNNTGLRDVHCTPRCPRANIAFGDFVCEYSSGDPTNAYETPPGESRYPLKCVNTANGKIQIRSNYLNRLCLFTKCANFSKSYRYYGMCDTGKTLYDTNVFYNGAAFFSDLATTAETEAYCGSGSAILNTDYEINDDLSKLDYMMVCNDHGQWKNAKDGTVAIQYSCPSISNTTYTKFFDKNFLAITGEAGVAKTSEYNDIASSSQYCGGFGLIKKKLA